LPFGKEKIDIAGEHDRGGCGGTGGFLVAGEVRVTTGVSLTHLLVREALVEPTSRAKMSGDCCMALL